MLYLDYAKQTENGYILNFFANSVEDLEAISEGKEFITKNGTNYGVPAPQSVVTITNKDGEKTTYLMGEDGDWIPGVVNPTDYYTKKQVDTKLEGKQDVLTAGNGIEIIENLVKIDENEITEIVEKSIPETPKRYQHRLRIKFVEGKEVTYGKSTVKLPAYIDAQPLIYNSAEPITSNAGVRALIKYNAATYPSITQASYFTAITDTAGNRLPVYCLNLNANSDTVGFGLGYAPSTEAPYGFVSVANNKNFVTAIEDDVAEANI